MAKERGHYKLNAALIEKAGRLAALGWPYKDIAEACGVSYEALYLWLANAKGEHPTELELQLLQVMQEALWSGAEQQVAKIAAGDTKDAQWLLTHSPRWRETWSDAAHVRREVNNVLATVAQVVQQSDLTPEQQDHLLLRMQAAGLGTAT
jgi:hypothetical protein